MTTITDFRHPLEKAALDLANRWCAGRQVGAGRALAHAVDVAGTLRAHVPDIEPEVTAALLLHDAPYFAPAGVDLYPVLTARISPEVARIVQALEDEHAAMSTTNLELLTDDRPVLLASTADKLVSMAKVLNRPGRPPAGFLDAVDYFHVFLQVAINRLPTTMASELAELVERAKVARDN